MSRLSRSPLWVDRRSDCFAQRGKNHRAEIKRVAGQLAENILADDAEESFCRAVHGLSQGKGPTA